LGDVEPSDALRYERLSGRLPIHLLQFSADKKPVVVWNVTGRCNLRCRHCYAAVSDAPPEDELTHEEGRALIDDLAAFGSPVLLLSGGEPLMRPDIFDLAEYAVLRGLRCVLSTNGTMVDEDTAQRLKRIGMSYIGISLDGLGATHDDFRRRDGAFDEVLAGLRASCEAGLKAGLRFTIFKNNAREVPAIFELVREERISRVCFYHLVCCGRGTELIQEGLTHCQTREIVDTIIDGAAALRRDGLKVEVLTVDNHCDGPYLYLRMLRENNPRASDVLELLRMNGGNSSGLGIACVGWDGTVYPDQFWRTQALGNVRQQPFSRLWTNPSNTFLMKLKEKGRYVTGRCARCRFLDACGGNLRVRAEALTGDPWAPDPACYLTDEEIGIA
jgi:radical SAM protein with 4Fe4S-binding SPASM domain